MAQDQGAPDNYDDLTTDVLLDLAQQRSIAGRSSMKKADLIEALRDFDQSYNEPEHPVQQPASSQARTVGIGEGRTPEPTESTPADAAQAQAEAEAAQPRDAPAADDG